MQKLIASWFAEANRLKKSIRAEKLAGRDTQTARLLQQVWHYCASKLANINTFRFCVGDQVEVIETGYVGTITERTEYLHNKNLVRNYVLQGFFPHTEDELQCYRK